MTIINWNEARAAPAQRCVTALCNCVLARALTIVAIGGKQGVIYSDTVIKVSCLGFPAELRIN